MLHSLRPWITASVALTGAAFFVVPPAAAPLTEVQAQHRQVSLKSYDEFDLTQLTTTTTANIDALESYFSTNPFTTDPDISQGFSTLFTDLASGTANPVTNPLSLLTEASLSLFSSGYGFSAASSALTGVSDNVQAAISSGDYSAALTDLENGPTTVLYAALNGYPESVGNGLISPEFGLLTSPDGSDLATGSIYAINQIQTTLADELSALGGNTATTTSSLVGPGSIDLSVNLDSILNGLGTGGNLTLPESLDSLLSSAFPSGDITLPVTLDALLTELGPSGGINLGVSLNDLLNGAVPGGDITLPVSLDSLLTGAATNGDISIPISPDTILGDVLGGGGSISVPPISLASIITDLGNPSYSLPFGLGSLSLSSFFSDVGINTSTTDITPPSISDATILSDLTSLLGTTGNQDISVSAMSLETLLGAAGSDQLSVSTATLEGLLGTSGMSDITLSVPDLETLLGATGNDPISLPLSDLTSILGTFGSEPISIPLSTIEGLLPSTLTLDLPIPDVTGTVPTFYADLSQDLLSVLGSIAPLSSDLPTLLTPDPVVDLVPLLSGLVGDLGLPVDIVGGDLPANLTGILADLLPSLF